MLARLAAVLLLLVLPAFAPAQGEKPPKPPQPPVVTPTPPPKEQPDLVLPYFIAAVLAGCVLAVVCTPTRKA
jgi:hypothetical protein